MNVGLADQHNQLTDEQGHSPRATVLKLFVIIAAVSFILRIAYAGHLYEDDGLWFTVGEEILRGKALYREIYFDKPPASLAKIRRLIAAASRRSQSKLLTIHDLRFTRG